MSLPELSRADRLLWSIVLVTAMLVALVTWLVLPAEKTGGLVRQPSTFFNAGYGVKAAYLVLGRLEYPVTRLRRPLASETLDGIGVLFVLKPLVGLRRFEMDNLETWVKQGHVLVVVPGSCLHDAFGGKERAAPAKVEEEDSEHRRQSGSFFEEWFHVDDGPADRAETLRDSPESDRAGSGQTVDAKDAICAGIHELATAGGRRFAESPLKGPLADMPTQTFWSDNRGPIGLRVAWGDGTIIALADAYPLTNLGIGKADNGLLLGNMARKLSELSPGKIVFDEYHLGFEQRDWSTVAILKLLLTCPWQWAVVQAIIVGMLALYAGAVRFGSPRDVMRKPRRQHREFAEAAGRLFDEAGATALAAGTLYNYYRGKVCRMLQLEPEADNARLSQAVCDRSGHEIAAILDRAETAASSPVSRQELLAITQTFHRAVEALDHGT
jgi:hypothetical protein